VFGTLLLVNIMYAWTCYAWLLEHDMYVCRGSYVMNEFSSFPSYETCISFLVMNLTKPLLSRMAPEMRGQARGNPPPPPEPSMEQVLRLMLEEREAARAEHQANLATLMAS
jgi:hypothetical protein